MESWDSNTLATVKKIPLLTVKAGPRDGEAWVSRLKEEYQALIGYVQSNKANDNDWFTISSNKEGTKWTGKCWYVHELIRYEFDLQFEVPVTYPATPFEIELPQLDGKTAKMYRPGRSASRSTSNPSGRRTPALRRGPRAVPWSRALARRGGAVARGEGRHRPVRKVRRPPRLRRVPADAELPHALQSIKTHPRERAKFSPKPPRRLPRSHFR